eukprot:UN04757
MSKPVDELPDVWIDSANVGHFAVHQGKFSFSQINRVYQDFMHKHNKRAAIVLSKSRLKYLEGKENARPVLKKWRDDGNLYVSPFQVNDDKWWIYGGLCCSQRGKEVLLVTNDQLRDHTSLVNEPLLFYWIQTHVVRYSTTMRKPYQGRRKKEESNKGKRKRSKTKTRRIRNRK